MINREDSALIARERQNRGPAKSGQRTLAQPLKAAQTKAPQRAGKSTANGKSALTD